MKLPAARLVGELKSSCYRVFWQRRIKSWNDFMKRDCVAPKGGRFTRRLFGGPIFLSLI